jgi:hypothetical protein
MMSGTVAISPDVRWSAAGWLFDWTVEFLSKRVTNAEVAGNLREILNENLGWLSLDDYGPQAGAELREIIERQLLAAADEQLPQTVPNRPGVIELLQELVNDVR